ncbi:MAG: MBL fold metallo-hydrolase [Pseudomonadota bacterium]
MLCKIGEIEVWRIMEIHAPFLPPETLYPTAGPDVGAIIEDLAPGSICPKTKRLILPVQGYLLKTAHHVILVDACVGNDKTVPGTPDWHKRSDNRFLAALTAAGVTPEDVDYVLCTHLHTDHVGWNTRLDNGRWVPTFCNAKYLMPAADDALHRQNDTDLYRESVLPVVQADQVEFVQADHKLGDTVTLIPTPGHTPGHVSVRLTSNGQEAIITGDALHSTAQCWHPDWHFKFDLDPEMAVTSRRALLTSAAETQSVVLGSHFNLPSLGHVKRRAAGFCWHEK